MPADCSQITDGKPTHRSRVTNGSRLFAGVDGRSKTGRRLRDIVAGLSADVGELGENERLLIRNAATLQVHAEDLAARIARGEGVDPAAITRATNAANRALAALRRGRAARKPKSGPSRLRVYLDQKQTAGG